MEKEVAGLPAYSANDSNERQLAVVVGGASHRAQQLNRDRDVCEFGQQLRGVREMWIRSIHKGVLKPAPFAWPQTLHLLHNYATVVRHSQDVSWPLEKCRAAIRRGFGATWIT